MRRVKGHITIYAALTIMLIMSLVCTCIRSALVSMTRAEIDAVCVLSNEAVFAGYSNKVLDEFDVLVLKKSDMLNKKLNWFLDKNTSSGSGSVELVSAQYDDYLGMTDKASYVHAQVLEYMKYEVYTDMLERMTGQEKTVKSSTAVSEVIEELSACQDKLLEQDKLTLELLQLVEGIRTNSTGFEVRNDMPVCTGNYFAKAAVGGNITEESIAIDNPKVYTEVVLNAGKCADVCGLLDDIHEDMEEYISIAEEHSEEDAAKSCQLIYANNCRDLKEIIDGAYQKTRQSLEVIGQIEEEWGKNKVDIENCRNRLYENEENIQHDVFAQLSSDILQMENQSNEKTGLCDVENVKNGLISNELILEQAYSSLMEFPEILDVKNCGEWKEKVTKLNDRLSLLDNTSLRFNYEHISFNGGTSGIGQVQKLYDSLKGGITEIVLDGKSISDKRIEQQDLADADMEDSTELQQEGMDKLIYGEYLLQKFNDFMDYSDDGQEYTANSEKLLDYTLEYILCGSQSDRENIHDVIRRLSLMREGCNMMYLVTNPEKRGRALELATALAGFSGNMAIVKAAQYVIMAAWAYGESIVDLKKLFNGGKVEMVKNDSNWELSLSNLLDLNLECDGGNDKGLDYDEYIRILLTLQEGNAQCYRTMSAMELRMLELGEKDFRMRNYICGCSGNVVFKLKSLGQTYAQQIEYRYY